MKPSALMISCVRITTQQRSKKQSVEPRRPYQEFVKFNVNNFSARRRSVQLMCLESLKIALSASCRCSHCIVAVRHLGTWYF